MPEHVATIRSQVGPGTSKGNAEPNILWHGYKGCRSSKRNLSVRACKRVCDLVQGNSTQTRDQFGLIILLRFLFIFIFFVFVTPDAA